MSKLPKNLLTDFVREILKNWMNCCRKIWIFRVRCFNIGSRSEYLESLRNDPPDKCNCNILSITENADDESLYYEYGKEGGCLTIAKLFRFKKNNIAEILLVFDSKDFV